MNSAKNYLLLLFVLTTLGGAYLAWRQYEELVDLRAAALDKNERADWQRRLWDLQKANKELSDQLAALRTENGTDLAGLVDDAARNRRETAGARGPRGGRGPGAQQIAALRDLIQRPEVQALWTTQQKIAIDGRYAALFRNLNLTPDQQEKLKSLLVERQTTLADVFLAARDQGIDPRTDPETFRKLVADTQNQINDSIKSTIGESGFAQLQTYEQTLPQRAVVGQLQQRLSYTDTPLTAVQADQLVTILAANTPPPPAENGPTPPAGPGAPPPGRGGPGFGGPLAGMGPGLANALDLGGGRGGAATVPITPTAVAQAAPVLAPQQLQVLEQMQQQQQAQQQLQQIVRETMAPPQPAAGPNPANGATAPAPRRRGGGGN